MPERQYRLSLFVFRRELRIKDNTALLHACERSDYVVTAFILDPAQTTDANKWKSQAAINFMVISLGELSREVVECGSKLLILNGPPHDVIANLLKLKFPVEHMIATRLNKKHKNDPEDVPEPIFDHLRIEAIFLNADYTPYSRDRDSRISIACTRAGIDIIVHHDHLLYALPIYNASSKTYKKFTPFYHAVRLKRPHRPHSGACNRNLLPSVIIENTHIPLTVGDPMGLFKAGFEQCVVDGGRKEGLSLLASAVKDQRLYDSIGDMLMIPTTRLSAHIKFGTISIREVWYTFRKISNVKSMHSICRQLIWREFNYNLAMGDTNVLTRSFDVKFENIKWMGSAVHLRRWKEGTTGVPIVDACMRQLATEHYLHNRGRMIVASYLVKDLLINWRHGEMHFAKTLVDYDPIQNFYNWQIIAGCAPFALPWYRVFNPWEQAIKYDPTGEYIRKWVPELRSISTHDIHRWYEYRGQLPHIEMPYPQTIIPHDEARDRALHEYKKIFK